MRKIAFVLLILWLAAITATAQQTEPADNSSSTEAVANQEVKETSVQGCLASADGEFTLTDAAGNQFRLVATAGLASYVGHEVSIGGTVAEDPAAPITVTEVKDILNPDDPLPGFSGQSWRTSGNKTYGFSLSYPEDFTLLGEADLRGESNFANSDGSISVTSVEIPDHIYPGSNFRGGYFTVIVNPNLSNAPACSQFGYAPPDSVSSRVVRGIRYSQSVDGEGAAGSAYTYYYLHTFQNGLCYEFKLEMAAANTGAYDLPCSIRLLSEQNKTDLLDSFLSRITFFRPTVSLSGRAHVPASKPLVTGLTPVAQPGDHSLEIKVSWTTKGADYVRLQLECNPNLVVTGMADYMECGNSSNRNFPPNGSATFSVSNPKGKGPIPFVLNLEPFAYGVGYPAQAKSVHIPVDPNPL